MKCQVECPLVGEDGNAVAILARFRQAARRGGWKPEEIEEVTAQAMTGDYDNLLRVISQFCKNA